MAGAAVLALIGRFFMNTEPGLDKAKCVLILEKDPPAPCLHISPDKKRPKEDPEYIQVYNAIPLMRPSVKPQTSQPEEPVCVTPPREPTPPARCEIPRASGEPAPKKPCVKQKFRSKYIPNADELRIPGCPPRAPKVPPALIPCEELEVELKPVVEAPKKKCNRRKCVSIDPAKRRWPLSDYGPAPNVRDDPKFAATCKCPPINPGVRRFWDF